MMTIEESKVENFPFKEGEQVEINWTSRPKETAVITKLFTSVQWGHNVVHAIMVQTESSGNFSIDGSLLSKIENQE